MKFTVGGDGNLRIGRVEDANGAHAGNSRTHRRRGLWLIVEHRVHRIHRRYCDHGNMSDKHSSCASKHAHAWEVLRHTLGTDMDIRANRQAWAVAQREQARRIGRTL